MSTLPTVVISDSEDADDCIIESVEFVENDSKEHYSDLYHEVYRENILLAKFIQRCLDLDNTEGMLKVLKLNLLGRYYRADKLARESLRFQKNLRRANFLICTDPQRKYTHIRDLCDILETLKVKKKVPFVTLTTNLKDNKSNDLKRSSTEPKEVTSSNSKKSRLESYDDSPFSETGIISFNDTSDALDETIDLCSQKSNMSEEDRLLVEQQNKNNEQAMFMEQRIRSIENAIAFYKRRITELDEMEVEDDSVNSPYLKCERLKKKIVSLYKELCQLKGSQPVKRKGIRLKVASGHPLGPTRALERFLNKNFTQNGDPPFPDFCDVVTCVAEADAKDHLGWTRAQIMKEASVLFTLCGRALQKRRQCREYRDLMQQVKVEDLQQDPADGDPELRAVLEENRRIAVKKEKEILERYTAMQYLPPKPKTQTSDTNVEATEKEIVVCEEVTNNCLIPKDLKDNIPGDKDEGRVSVPLEEYNGDSMIDNNNEYKTSLTSEDRRGTTQHHHKSEHLSEVQVTNEKFVTESTLLHNIDKKCNETHYKSVRNKTMLTNGRNHKIKSSVKHKDKSVSNYHINENEFSERKKIITIENQMAEEKITESLGKQKPEQNIVSVLDKLGDNFTVTVEIMND